MGIEIKGEFKKYKKNIEATEELTVLKSCSEIKESIESPTALQIGILTKISGDVTSHGSISIGKGSIILGDIKSDGDIVINAACKIYGNVSAVGRILILNDTTIKGNVRSNTDVWLGSQVTAQRIRADGDIIVYQTAMTESIEAKGKMMSKPFWDFLAYRTDSMSLNNGEN